jgi:hypothetical protein
MIPIPCCITLTSAEDTDAPVGSIFSYFGVAINAPIVAYTSMSLLRVWHDDRTRPFAMCWQQHTSSSAQVCLVTKDETLAKLFRENFTADTIPDHEWSHIQLFAESVPIQIIQSWLLSPDALKRTQAVL